MNNQTAASIAEQMDKILQKIAFGVLLVATAYAISVIEFFVSTGNANILNNLSTALGVLAIVLVLPGFIKIIQLKRKHGAACKEPEGFIVEIFNQATGKAFQFTFIFLILLEIFNGAALAHLPGEFFIKLIIAVTLAIFSLTFFVLSRSGADDNFDDDFADGTNS